MYVVFEVLFEGGKSFAIKRHAACMGLVELYVVSRAHGRNMDVW